MEEKFLGVEGRFFFEVGEVYYIDEKGRKRELSIVIYFNENLRFFYRVILEIVSERFEGIGEDELEIVFKCIEEFVFFFLVECFVKVSESFVVRFFRKGEYRIMSVEIVKMVGEVIFERFLCFGSLKVNFDYLMVIFRVEFVGEVFFFGIDIIGDSLFYKRFWCVYDYFVYFKVSIVNVFIELVELNGGLFIDFFCGSGMILIEFVFRGYKGRIIGFEKYRKYIRGVEMNVLLVGVFDKIEFI